MAATGFYPHWERGHLGRRWLVSSWECGHLGRIWLVSLLRAGSPHSQWGSPHSQISPSWDSTLRAGCLTTETGFELIRFMAVEDKTNASLLTRITVRPDVFGGKPIVRDMRISVELVLSLLAQGVTPAAIMEDYPDLEADDIRACIATD